MSDFEYLRGGLTQLLVIGIGLLYFGKITFFYLFGSLIGLLLFQLIDFIIEKKTTKTRVNKVRS